MTAETYTTVWTLHKLFWSSTPFRIYSLPDPSDIRISPFNMPLIPSDQLPRTPSEVLETGTIDPAFAAALEKMPIPRGKDWTIDALKSLVSATLPQTQAKLTASRPDHITESQHFIPTRDGWKARTIVCRRSTPDPIEPRLLQDGCQRRY